MKRIKQYFKIDSLKSFIELPVLWLMVSFFSSLSVAIAVVIIYNSNIEISLDYHGFNNFVEIFKVPLAIMAIVITIVAFLATAHRSVQTREQLINTNKQNVFSNYFKHIEEFEKYIIKSVNTKLVHFNNIRQTHKFLFPNSIEGDLSVNINYLEDISTAFKNCKKLLREFNQSDEISLFQTLYDINMLFDELFSLLNITLSYSGVQVVRKEKKIILQDKDVRSTFQFIQQTAIVLVEILSFDHYVNIPDELLEISKIDLSKIPEYGYEHIDEIKSLDFGDYLLMGKKLKT